MSSSREKKRNFVVKMYKSEYQQIQAWVAKHQHLETGGDLFGLWADDHSAVVQLVLGPGKHCRRTAASFYQDLDYLEQVGKVLTKEEGLCHIGEWHSHHRIGLKEPSGGDEDTVWRNMKTYGIHRFFLFIATIEGCSGSYKRRSDSSLCDVRVRCFLFEIDAATERRNSVLEGKIDFMPETDQKSPFRFNTELEKVLKLEMGAESINSMKDLKEFERRVRGRESDDTKKMENKMVTDKSCPPQRTDGRSSNKRHKETRNTKKKKTIRSTVNIELSNQKSLRKNNEEGTSTRKKSRSAKRTNKK